MTRSTRRHNAVFTQDETSQDYWPCQVTQLRLSARSRLLVESDKKKPQLFASKQANVSSRWLRQPMWAHQFLIYSHKSWIRCYASLTKPSAPRGLLERNKPTLTSPSWRETGQLGSCQWLSGLDQGRVVNLQLVWKQVGWDLGWALRFHGAPPLNHPLNSTCGTNSTKHVASRGV